MDTLYKKYLECGGAVSTDTRSIAPGSLFFALRGERFDANAFAAAALAAGARYAVVDNPAVAGSDERFIVVGDSLAALQQLAARHRRQLAIPILAITGSNGKTTTKELAALVLSRKFAVSVTRGNLNNHIGVPLTLLAMTAETQLGIVEMGASAQGEIALLCSIAAPDYGIITNIGRAHLEGFGSVEGVAKGKGELFDYLDDTGGTAFCALCDKTVSELAAARKQMRTVPYPCYETISAGSENLTVAYEGRRVASKLVGEYNRLNISAALAIGEFFGVNFADMADAISSYEPDNKRSQKINGQRNVIIADCYNANPSSMAAALNNFIAEPSRRPKALILGDMLELGAFSDSEHDGIIKLAAGSPVGKIIVVGENFLRAAAAHPDPKITAFGTFDELAAWLAAEKLSGYYILIKGSRGIGLERSIELL